MQIQNQPKRSEICYRGDGNVFTTLDMLISQMIYGSIYRVKIFLGPEECVRKYQQYLINGVLS